MNAPAHPLGLGRPKGHYPSKARVRLAAEMLDEARRSGLDVAALEVAPDGTIRVFSPAAFPAAPRDEFETWDLSGKLG